MKTKTKQTIRVCGSCDTPLIWTFAFDGSERFCINCGRDTPMFDGSEGKEATRELIFKKKLVDAIWDVIYGKKGYLPSGRFGRSYCEKCRTSNSHRDHLTKSEIEWDEIARKYLSQVEGMFNDKPITND